MFFNVIIKSLIIAYKINELKHNIYFYKTLKKYYQGQSCCHFVASMCNFNVFLSTIWLYDIQVQQNIQTISGYFPHIAWQPS